MEPSWCARAGVLLSRSRAGAPGETELDLVRSWVELRSMTIDVDLVKMILDDRDILERENGQLRAALREALEAQRGQAVRG